VHALLCSDEVDISKFPQMKLLNPGVLMTRHYAVACGGIDPLEPTPSDGDDVQQDDVIGTVITVIVREVCCSNLITSINVVHRKAVTTRSYKHHTSINNFTLNVTLSACQFKLIVHYDHKQILLCMWLLLLLD
jgi:hypothetical protein